jgi:phospholipid-translocating ATPase
MSVIVMDKNGQIWIYTKGAESHVLPLCRDRNGQLTSKTLGHINDFAKEGLRTLAIARRKMTKSEFIKYSNELIDASNSLTNRSEKVEICQRKIETGLELLGATAVEDACKYKFVLCNHVLIKIN